MNNRSSLFAKTITRVAQQEFAVKFPYGTLNVELKKSFNWAWCQEDKCYHVLLENDKAAELLKTFGSTHGFTYPTPSDIPSVKATKARA